MAESPSQTTLSSAISQKQARRSVLTAEKARLESRIADIDIDVALIDIQINDLQTTTGSIRPVPTLTGLSLSIVELESTGNTLSVTGTGFDAVYTQIAINGVAQATTVNSSTSASCDIPDVSAQTVQTLLITVINSAPGGGVSPSLSLQVVYGAPTLSSLDVTTVAAGTGDTLVTLSGTNFYDDSVAYVNGVAVVTALAGSDLQITVVAGSFATAGIPASIYVRNPTPGGGASETLLITVT